MVRNNLYTWEEDYSQNNIPWDSLSTPDILKNALNNFLTAGSKILEIGCGTGYDSKEFIRRNAHYLGIDVSRTAIKKAKQNVPDGEFFCIDFFNLDLIEYDVIYDKGVFHNIKDRQKRDEFALHVAARLKSKGIWIQISGCMNDAGNQKHGQLFLSDIVESVEPYFEILWVEKGSYGEVKGNLTIDAWCCVMRKR